MIDDHLSRNLQRYPNLTDLFLTDVAKTSRFLYSISLDMQKKPLTQKQAFIACRIIAERKAEKKKHEVQV